MELLLSYNIISSLSVSLLRTGLPLTFITRAYSSSSLNPFSIFFSHTHTFSLSLLTAKYFAGYFKTAAEQISLTLSQRDRTQRHKVDV
ncbi:hypothetical protein MtrunA17_Chr4g0022321 [Medicago truncatula]|uniref:Uncharacterized protein n=1 Tax=Medicago truncatula TaxID=3880 RepID=A0A396I3H9_MEDTR|nr:hypothetical protein MtrunA17_Chr4g0022321 [Medicago truncatula]